MRIALFGGSFDPVHREHVALVETAVKELRLDRAIVLPSFIAPHKRAGSFASAQDRLAMCRIAFSHIPQAEVSDYELKSGGTSYTYLTAEHFFEEYRGAELFWLVGADMLNDFFFWKYPERILSRLTLVACRRADDDVSRLHEKFIERFQKDFMEISFAGTDVSSTRLRVALAFSKPTCDLPPKTEEYIRERGLYTYNAIAPALALEKETRREHSFRVALLACTRARSVGVWEGDALLAAALHDCGKYVPLHSPLLSGFRVPQNVPEPVLHQYTGAYLAEHVFHISNREILDAIRYHTSGKPNMTTLGKLIFLADMLEEGRTFTGADALRSLYFKDLDACLCASLSHQIAYLKSGNQPIYPLTEQAFLWIKGKKTVET